MLDTEDAQAKQRGVAIAKGTLRCGTPLLFASVHLTFKQQEQQMIEVLDELNRRKIANLVLACDFNFKHGRPPVPHNGLADAWAAVHPGAVGPGAAGATYDERAMLIRGAPVNYQKRKYKQERFDRVLFRLPGWRAAAAELVGGEPLPDVRHVFGSRICELWPSDYWGVLVTLQRPPRHHRALSKASSMRGAALLCLLLAAWAAGARSQQTETKACYWAGPRVACGAPGGGPLLTQAACEAAGCCWLPPAFADAPEATPPGGPRPQALPTCVTPNNEPSLYQAVQVQQGGAAGAGLAALLSLSSATHSELGQDVPMLRAEVGPVTQDIARIRITDAEQARWQVPPSLFHPSALLAQLGAGRGPPPPAAHAFDLATGDAPFSIDLSRKAASAGMPSDAPAVQLLNTTATRLDQYLELTTWLSPSAVLFGGGSANRGSMQAGSAPGPRIPRNGYPLVSWNRDLRPGPLADVNSYSTSTLILALDKGTAFGYLLLNSNGLEVVAQPDRLTWRMIGGVVDLFVLAGPMPLDVLRQAATLVGMPAMPPFWALGFHANFHYNAYHDCEALHEVSANYSAAGIPVEVWTDGGDWMDSYRLFTLSPLFNASCMKELKARGQRWLPWIIPTLKAREGGLDPSYQLYEQALAGNALMLDGLNQTLLAQLFPGPSVLLDWASDQAAALVSQNMKQFNDLVPFDGWGASFEEPTSYCSGDVCNLNSNVLLGNLTGTWNWTEKDTCPWCGCNDMHCISAQCTWGTCTELKPLQTSLAFPPLDLNNGNAREPLGGVSNLARHANGWRLATFPGDSAYAGTYEGNACWSCGLEDIAMTPAQTINMGLAGFPASGAGINCQDDPKICAIWVMLGAFFPLARNTDRPLYNAPETIAAAQDALAFRYQLLPYLYTLMYQGTFVDSTSSLPLILHLGAPVCATVGAPVARPMWAEFPQDPGTYGLPSSAGPGNATWQFMLGDAVLVSPAINTTQAPAYFPQGLWYSAWNYSDVVDATRAPLNASLPLPNVTLEVANGTDPGVVNIGQNPCSFLTAAASIAYNASARHHSGSLTITIGVPPPPGAPTANFSWPPLGNVTVLGWHVPAANVSVEAGGAAFPIAAPAPTPTTVTAAAGPANGASADTPPAAQAVVDGAFAPGSLHVDVRGMALPLACGSTTVLRFQEA
eukprot:scaffold4.g4722.t1